MANRHKPAAGASRRKRKTSPLMPCCSGFNSAQLIAFLQIGTILAEELATLFDSKAIEVQRSRLGIVPEILSCSPGTIGTIKEQDMASTIRHFAGRFPRSTIILAAAGLAVATVAGTAPARMAPGKTAPHSNRQAVAAATANFYVALNTMFTGNGQPMKDAWSHAADVTYMGPDGQYLIGWDKVGPRWDAQAAAKLGGHVSAEQINIVAGTDMAVATCVEVGENIVNGKTEAVRLRATNVFRKEAGKWKLIGHQTDLLGYMNKPS